MKFLVSTMMIALGITELVTAFTPTFGLPTSAGQMTKAFLIPDPDLIHTLSDAVRAVVLECDQNECVMSHGVREGNQWVFEGGLEGPPQGQITHKVMMMSVNMEDGE